MKGITQKKRVNGKPKLRHFHQAKWDEPIIFELSTPGERGILIPEAEDEIKNMVGDVISSVPEKMRRKEPSKLPELAQPKVLRHYLRLSQETLGADISINLQGTCTMKYSPKVNEQLARLPQITELHPLQPEETVQGILEIMYKFEQILKEISGLDKFSFQPGGGSQAIYTNASIIRAYHESRGEANKKTEIITTIFSHPSNAACARTAGFKVITIYPNEDGYPDIEALKAAVSDRTAGLMITNPEDTGIFNPKIEEIVNIIHEVGGLCAYDQANTNGILGITRAKEAGFDLCHFNLHKAFSSPHGCGGPGAGAIGATKEIEDFLPIPTVEFDGNKYYLEYNRPKSIGKVRSWYGVIPVILRAYAWVMSLGAEGLREVAEVAVLNNNYLLKRMSEIPGVSIPYVKKKIRVEQVRYSWEKLAQDTGVHTEDIGRRAADFGILHWLSHHPWIVSEPCTFEPTESYSKAELDEFIEVFKQIANEAYSNPEIIKTAPHNSTIHKINHVPLDDPSRWAITWRAYCRKALVEK